MPGIVDTYVLKYEVVADYPYSTVLCDTEEEAIRRIVWEKDVHDVGCTVRVVGAPIRYYGYPSVGIPVREGD